MRMQGLKAHEKGVMATIVPTWLSPEILQHGSYSTASDIYALGMMITKEITARGGNWLLLIGIILWELASREHPFNEIAKTGKFGEEAVRTAVLQGGELISCGTSVMCLSQCPCHYASLPILSCGRTHA